MTPKSDPKANIAPSVAEELFASPRAYPVPDRRASGPKSQPVKGYLHRDPFFKRDDKTPETAIVDANRVYYRELNATVDGLIRDGVRDLTLTNVNGQRYIANGQTAPDLHITIEGTPGQDLGMFLGGPQITVTGNAQDGVGNTMEAGSIVVHGSAGDVVGYGMRGGEVFIKGDAGYRVGIHMKQYKDRVPTIVVGGKARAFFGEYMAGGRMVLLNLCSQLDGDEVGAYMGSGMHGGEIYVRGEVQRWQCGREVGLSAVTAEEMDALTPLITRFCETFDLDVEEALHSVPFTKIAPTSSRPYGNLYANL
jgi:glutamate synthase domain-containing protein 3